MLVSDIITSQILALMKIRIESFAGIKDMCMVDLQAMTYKKITHYTNML